METPQGLRAGPADALGGPLEYLPELGMLQNQLFVTLGNVSKHLVKFWGRIENFKFFHFLVIGILAPNLASDQFLDQILVHVWTKILPIFPFADFFVPSPDF